MLVIGLTGGICCGKTTVSEQFSQFGIPIIDADEISRTLLSGSLYSHPSPALLKVSEYFGKNLFDNKGHLIRSKLKDLIFSSSNANNRKKELEALMHPLVYEEINRLIQYYKNLLSQQKAALAYLIVSIPLLIETADLKLFDRILVIDIDEQSQIKRCSKRDSISIEQIKKIINTQMPRDKRLTYADDILDNSQSINSLNNHINKLHQFYLQLSQHTTS
jgi:dephospho-CoA kinase